jgi:hypothetical protein
LAFPIGRRVRERVVVKSPVRENRPPGSVRGAPDNRRPYRNPTTNSNHKFTGLNSGTARMEAPLHLLQIACDDLFICPLSLGVSLEL